MKFSTLLVLIYLIPFTSAAQITIQGTVRDAQTGAGMENINVMIQKTDRRAVYGYALTGENGSYSITYKGQADSLLIVITGFNIKTESRIVLPFSQQVDFEVRSQKVKIPEVLVKAPPITRRSDTLTYIVEKFSDATDRSIGDVLKKMPGIEVSKSGEISYNGKAINRFYVEDMDMLGGRYGIATNNIQAKDIASVQIYEKHQPIKALRKHVSSDQAALNLRLKPSARGAWNATMQLGTGYQPWLWNAEMTALFFGRRFQTINTYKTNNSGDDVSRELQSFSGGLGGVSSLLGVHTPSTPALDKERYFDNNVHTLSLNTITKLKKNLELVANAQYIHDQQISRGTSVTTYYLPETTPLVIREQTYASKHTDQTEIDFKLRSNTSQRYLEETFSLNGRWDKDLGKVLNDADKVIQSFRLPRISLRNELLNIRQFRKTGISFRSQTDYVTQPTSLSITPMLYPEIFDSPAGYPDARQTLNSQRFRTHNSVSMSYRIKYWSFSVNTDFNAHLEWMNSALNAINDKGLPLPAPDTMRNDIYWRKLDLILGPSIRFRKGDKLGIQFQLPFDFMSLRIQDKVQKTAVNKNEILLKPSLSLDLILNYNLSLWASASYSENIGDLYDTYSGYIMSDYRIIASKKGDISRKKTQTYSTLLTYKNVFKALFWSLNASYWHSRQNLMYGTQYEGTLSHIESYPIAHSSQGYNVTAKISKRLDALSTTCRLSGGFSRSWYEVLRQGKIMQTSSDRMTAGLGINTNFTKAFILEYTADFSRSRSHIQESEKLEPIYVVRQNATMNLVINKKWICSVGGEHYHNGTIVEGDRNMFFLDAWLSYRTARVEYSLEGRNLLNTGTFRSAIYNDITNYVYSYQLRPASVMFKIKFSLK